MRLFTAIELDEGCRQALQEAIDAMPPGLPMRWVRQENQHLTLKFIGEWPERRCDEVVEALRRVRSGTIRFTVTGLGVLPNLRSPRVFLAGLRHDDELPRLAAKVNAALAPLGIERERRAYRPHVTLGRVKGRIRPAELQRAIDEHGREFGLQIVNRFVLFASELRPSGAVYRKIEEFPLTGGDLPDQGRLIR